MTIYVAAMKQEDFDSRYKGILAKQFPHITFKFETDTPGNKIEEKVVRGETPDLMKTDLPLFRFRYLDLGLGEDLTPYIAKYKYDMSRFNQSFVKELGDLTKDGKIYGLPAPPYIPSVLYYNKSLFDKFGVPYPKDGMTFDEVYELAKKLTRTEGGTTYRGFSVNLHSVLRENPFSLPILDPAKDALADPVKWQQLFSNLKRFYEIPGNDFNKTFADEANVFNNGTSAMEIDQLSTLLKLPDTFEWDVVSIPTLTGAPQRVIQRGPGYWTMANTSKHKDEVFEVMMALSSDEVQMSESRLGMPTTLVNKEIQAALAQDFPLLKTKNMKAATYYPPTDPVPKRDQNVTNVDPAQQLVPVYKYFIEYVTGKTDLNAALRMIEEENLKLIEAEKAKKK